MTNGTPRRAQADRPRRAQPGLQLLGLLLAAALPLQPLFGASASSEVAEETLHIAGPVHDMKLGVRHAWLPQRPAGPVVLILPGAAVPVSGNPDYPFAGKRSLMTALAESGLDVWALDYYGFGESDRYPQMDEPPDAHAALGTASECADQVEAFVAFLNSRGRAAQLMLLGDSGGTLPAGVFATRHPEQVRALVLFGPVTPFTGGPAAKPLPAYDLFGPEELWAMFTRWSEAAGSPPVLDSSAFRAWAVTYLRSDPTSQSRTPPSVRVPNGRQADLAEVAKGRFPYEPGAIRASTLIVMGEWDEIATFAGAEWLLHSLRQAQQRRLVVIGHGSHTIQFEAEREQLYRVMADFFRNPDGPLMP